MCYSVLHAVVAVGPLAVAQCVTVSAKMQKVVQLLCVSLLLGRWLFPVTVAAAAATVQLGVVVSSSRDRQFTSMWAGLQAASGCRPIAMLASKSAVQEFG